MRWIKSRLVETQALDGVFESLRTPDAETAGRVRLNFIEAEADFSTRQVEAIFPDEESFGVSQGDLALALTDSEGRGIVERWLSEARVARDTARFALPCSLARFGAGDVVNLDGQTYRIDRVEQAEAAIIEAVRSEKSIYTPSDSFEDRRQVNQFVPPMPVYPVFLDLPLMTGDEVPFAPHIAVTARPWPQSVGVWSAVGDAGYDINRVVGRVSVIGVAQTPLAAATAGVWDRGAPLRIKLSGGVLAGADQLGVLGGANALAIGDGSSDNWEVIQFQDVDLIAPGVYEVSRRLRGQLGTDGIMPAVWPSGSLVVLLDKSLIQLDMPQSARGLARNYRIGALARGVDDPDAIHRVEAFTGIGLRPYSPAHLRANLLPNGDRMVSWVRRTRIDGDSWESLEVPLGEEQEQYLIRIMVAGAIVRELTVSQQNWVYGSAMQAADAGVGAVLMVAQLSDRFGPGPFATISLNH